MKNERTVGSNEWFMLVDDLAVFTGNSAKRIQNDIIGDDINRFISIDPKYLLFVNL